MWVANDTSGALPHSHVAWRIAAAGKTLLSGVNQADVQPLDATPAGKIDLSAIIANTPVVTISLALSDAAGKQVSCYQREVYLKAWQTPH